MKTRIIFFVGIFIISLSAQERNQIELVTQSINFQNKIIKYTMEAVGQVWDHLAGGTFWLTDDYQLATEVIDTPGNHISCDKRFNQCWHLSQGWELFGYGLYKL